MTTRIIHIDTNAKPGVGDGSRDSPISCFEEARYLMSVCDRTFVMPKYRQQWWQWWRDKRPTYMSFHGQRVLYFDQSFGLGGDGSTANCVASDCR